MPRAKGGPKTRWRRKRILKRAKGYWGARRKLFAVAKETVDRALAYAFAGRFDEALQQYDRSIEIDPNFRRAFEGVEER